MDQDMDQQDAIQQEDATPVSRTWKSRFQRFWREWVLPIGLIIILGGAFRSAVADWNDVPTGSMKPTILEGDRILVNKLAYDLRVPFTDWRLANWSEPQAGEIVICFSPANGDRLVKRVVAVPGDTVAMVDNRLVINGAPLAYSQADKEVTDRIIPDEFAPYYFATEALGEHPHTTMFTPSKPAPRTFDPIVVPPNHYFVMGDNRDNSADSRYFGFVDRARIVGRTSRVAFSLDYDHWHLPRWDRFLTPLDED